MTQTEHDDVFSDQQRFWLEASAVLSPTLVMLVSLGPLFTVFVVAPLLYSVDKHVYRFALFDALRPSDDHKSNGSDRETYEAEIIDD